MKISLQAERDTNNEIASTPEFASSGVVLGSRGKTAYNILQWKNEENKTMAVIKPFPCIRPEKTVADQVAALPYDVYNRAEAKAAVAGKPLSFFR